MIAKKAKVSRMKRRELIINVSFSYKYLFGENETRLFYIMKVLREHTKQHRRSIEEMLQVSDNIVRYGKIKIEVIDNERNVVID